MASVTNMLSAKRYREISASFPQLRLALVGDFCLDRYLEIDPELTEISIETGLPVHNVVNVRSQPGGAGTILNNLCALGIGGLIPIGFCGEDGEGFELLKALATLPGVEAKSFLRTKQRRTFTYCKPLTVTPNRAPEEHSRLDTKNWQATPDEVTDLLISQIDEALPNIDAMILLDQVDVAETGVVTSRLLNYVEQVAADRPELLILADSRRTLRDFPPVCFKMNATELAQLAECATPITVNKANTLALDLAQRNGRHVFVTLSEQGMLAASPTGESEHVQARIPRGPIDIVGAGDCVAANLTAALAAGATMREALEVATTAAYLVIQQLGTTGSATAHQIAENLRLA